VKIKCLKDEEIELSSIWIIKLKAITFYYKRYMKHLREFKENSLK